MKKLVSLLFMFCTLQVNATTVVTELLTQMKSADEFQRYDLSYKFCASYLEKGDLKNSQVLAEYQQAVQQLGDAWNIEPELPFMVLSDCQSLWKAKYLDPLMTRTIQDQHQRLRIDNLIAVEGLFGIPKYLRENIQLFLTTASPMPHAPPAPFEILSGLASSDRQLDTALEAQRREMNALFASGTLAAGIVGYEFVRGAIEFTRMGTFAASRVLWPLIFAWGGVEVVKLLEENRAWVARQKDLRQEIKKITQQLMDPKGTVPKEMLMQEFEKLVRSLSFFYSYDLLAAEAGEDKKRALPSAACLKEVHAYFSVNSCPTDMLRRRFEVARECPDAANTWIGASLFLKERFPKNAQAQLIANEMMNDAKHAVQLYEITQKHLTEQFDCQSRWNPMRAMPASGEITCDPVTGEPIY